MPCEMTPSLTPAQLELLAELHRAGGKATIPGERFAVAAALWRRGLVLTPKAIAGRYVVRLTHDGLRIARSDAMLGDAGTKGRGHG